MISVTIDGFRIDDQIYSILWCSVWLHITVYYRTHAHTRARAHTTVHSYVCISRCSVAASNGGFSPSFGFPYYPVRQLPASHSNSSQRLKLSGPLSNLVTHSLTHSLTNQRLFTSLNSTELSLLYFRIYFTLLTTSFFNWTFAFVILM
jgi:hypothetical protein